MGNQIIDIDLAIHVPVDNLRHLRSAFSTAKCGSFPDPSCNELKRPGGNFLTRTGYTNNDTDTPTPVAAFQRLTHGVDVANTFETIIRTAVSQVDQISNQIISNLFWINEMRHSKVFGEGFLGVIEIDTDDFVRPAKRAP